MRIAALSRTFGLLALLGAAGCAGRWMRVGEPNIVLRDRYPRDFRVTLRNDSVIVLREAVARNDSLVEVPSGATGRARVGSSRAVALADVERLDLWQEGGERVAGGVAVGLMGGVIALIAILAASLGGGGS